MNPEVMMLKSVNPLKIKMVVAAPNIVSEYGQEIPQSQTADNPMAPRGRAAQPPRDTRKTNKTKQPATSSPSRRLQPQNGHKVTHNKT